MAVASIGGHWVQLLRIARPMEKRFDMVYVSTHRKCATMVEGQKFYQTEDFSRSDAWKMIPSFFRMIKLVWQEKPKAIITTGAAPGLMGLLVGWMMRKKTIWGQYCQCGTSVAEWAHSLKDCLKNIHAVGRSCRRQDCLCRKHSWKARSKCGVMDKKNGLNYDFRYNRNTTAF